jgi:hypothetical protein
MTEQQKNNINFEDLAKYLEPLIRKVIREELTKLAKARPDIFFLDPSMPIYNDMEDIIKRDKNKSLKFHSHEEVWGD